MVAPALREIVERTLEHREGLVRKQLEARAGADLKLALREIRRARIRLRSRAYGYCEACFLTMPWKDLVARPERRLCSRCEESIPGPAPRPRTRRGGKKTRRGRAA